MTDGIIQEVFDKHLSDKKIHLGDYLMCKRIQQELIEKIKQEFEDRNQAYLTFRQIQHKLIGESQE